MRFWHLVVVAASFSVAWCQSTYGQIIADADVSIVFSDVGNGFIKKVIGGTTSSSGIHVVQVTLNGNAVVGTPDYDIDLQNDGDTIELSLSVESNCTTTDSSLGFEFNLVYVPNMSGELPVFPTYTMTGNVSATATLGPGESGSGSASIASTMASTAGPTTNSGTFEFDTIDMIPIPVHLTATSSCVAIPEPSGFWLLSIVPVVGLVRKRLGVTL